MVWLSFAFSVIEIWIKKKSVDPKVLILYHCLRSKQPQCWGPCKLLLLHKGNFLAMHVRHNFCGDRVSFFVVRLNWYSLFFIYIFTATLHCLLFFPLIHHLLSTHIKMLSPLFNISLALFQPRLDWISSAVTDFYFFAFAFFLSF